MYYHDFETESPKKRADRKWKAIKTLLEKASLFSNEFKARISAAGMSIKDIKNLEDYGNIPVLRKKDLISLQDEHGLEWLLSCELGELRRIYQSPGPIYDPEGNSRDYWGWAEGFFAAGFRPKDIVQMTFSYHLTPARLRFARIRL